MRSISYSLFALIIAFESVATQYNWDAYNTGFRPQPTYNLNYQPEQPQSYGSYYRQPSNSFYGQPNSFYTAPSYRYYPTQKPQNTFYTQPLYLSNTNDNYQQPQSLQHLNSYDTRFPQNTKINLNTARVSERKCEEYLKMSQRNVSVSSLTLKPVSHNIQLNSCDTSQGLIINGENAKAGEFPHMAAIGYKDKHQVVHFICGGSLISDQFVLSAAHCRTSSFVRLGVLNLKVTEQGSHEQDIAIESFISHENYDPGRKKNDIAVIKLASKVTLSKFIRPACLMTPNNQAAVQKAVVTGWGLTEAFTGHTSDILQKAELKIKSVNTCRHYLDDENVDSTQICAGDKRRDTCSGDSGGPLQIISPKNKCIHIIVGITSYGSQYCGAQNAVAVYVKVSAYIDWIEQKVWGSGS